jgi:hypothetical protein
MAGKRHGHGMLCVNRALVGPEQGNPASYRKMMMMAMCERD